VITSGYKIRFGEVKPPSVPLKAEMTPVSPRKVLQYPASLNAKPPNPCFSGVE
jgi:hypothetical protein